MAKYIKTEEGYKGLEESISAVTDPVITKLSTDKMDKTNPVGTGSFSMNRKVGTVIGTNSHAEGDNTTASGYSSHAEGIDTTASGYSSHAEGNYTDASGYNSHAEGGSTTASGNYSHTEGNGTKASGYNSHAEGGLTTASGNSSHAEGASTNRFSSVVTTTNPTTGNIITAWKTKKFSVAKGDYSHVEGKDNLALGNDSHAEGGSTEASGDHSHTEGSNTTASGDSSHAEGDHTIASQYTSHAEGYQTKASGRLSHAEGNGTTASGDNSHAEGFSTKASGDYSHVQGKYNIEDTSNKYADIIGNGTITARSNAATVDWSGNAWFAGDVYTGSTSGTNKDEGSKKLATEEYVNSSIAAGRSDISLGLTSAAVGQIIKVKAVDNTGKPTAWEAAYMPSGGVDKKLRWAQVLEMTTTEQMNIIKADKDPEGRTFASYNAIAMLTVLSIPADSTQTSASGTVWVTAQPTGYNSRASCNIANWKKSSRTISQCHLGTAGGLVWCGVSNSGSMTTATRIDNIFTVVKIEVHNADDHLPIGTTVRVFLLSEENE